MLRKKNCTFKWFNCTM